MAELNESPEAIAERMRRRYIERLATKMRAFRKQLAEKQWEAIREECEQMIPASKTYGLETLSRLAQEVLDVIPPGKVSKVAYLPHAREAVSNLIAAIDRTV